MEQQLLESRFARMGARLKLEDGGTRARGGGAGRYSIDVRHDGKGEFFEIRTGSEAALEFEIVDLQAAERHLLLLVREGESKQKFLCGHDERQWFVAAVPDAGGIATVQTAMEALKPVEVRQAQARRRVKTADRNRRKTEAYVRQGEWFFLPAPNLKVDERLVLRNEPLSRGQGSKPHLLEFSYRSGGEAVYVCPEYPSGVSEREYSRLQRTNPASRGWNWQVRRRNPELYVKGRVSHPDHKTIELREWHRVLMNTENQSAAMRNVAFLD
jgi:hypothetical protein